MQQDVTDNNQARTPRLAVDATNTSRSWGRWDIVKPTEGPGGQHPVGLIRLVKSAHMTF